MTFTDLCNEVYAITNRPDLVAETKSAVKAATLKCHHFDFFYKDLLEVPLQWQIKKFLQEFEYRTQIPRYRALKYIRHFDVMSDSPGDFFEILDPTVVLDSYGVHRDNAAYVAGELVKLRCSREFDYVLFGCYVHPSILEGSYSSWVALEYPYAIIYEAAASVFKMVGFDEQSAAMRAEAANLLIELRNSNILAQGE